MQRVILHLDMDAFFAAVEQADNPELKGRPVVVGGGKRGVVAAASYEARAFGIRSAMPAATARRLCPHAVFVPGRHRRYGEVSARIMELLRRRVPLVEQVSVDECYLDLTGTERLAGPPQEQALALKDAVREETGLTCSIGMAPNKFLAKVCSDLNKPNGLYVLPPEGVAAFLAALPVGKVPGIGPRAQQALHLYGVRLAADVLRFPESFWLEKLGKWGAVLYERAQGKDDRPVAEGHETKSVSAENTFGEDTADREFLRRWLYRQAERVGEDMRRHGFFGRTVTLKVKFADFTAISRSRSLPRATNATRVIYATAAQLLDGVNLARKVRLVGVGVSNFDTGEGQLALLPDVAGPQADRLDAAVDAIRARFGHGAVTPGRLLGLSNDPSEG